ncbi:10577_t:CDS:2, partial [Acaulospora colombiana]
KTEDELFRKKLITFEQFSENPQLLNDKNLILKCNNRYYTWPNAAPLITSLIVFNKPLPETTETKSSGDRLEDLSSPDRRKYSLRNWSHWWTRSASSQHTGSKEIIKEDPKNEDKKEATSQDAKKPTKFYAKTLRLTSDQLKSLNLKKGVNTMSFSVPSSYQGKATCAAKLFFWDYDVQIVISDIDGTITKSDALGHVFTMIGRDWTHSGVAKLYSDIRRNGYQILYLTSRAIGQADYTRDYLEKVKQDKYQLPDGPVIMSPDRLLTAFHREVIMRKPEVFKMSCLRDVQKLFGDRNPFFAGFGNRITDALSYRSVNVSPSRIFTIDSNGEVKLELLSGYKSSYVDLSDLVDQMFPHIGSNKWDTVYNDWNYWKSDILEVELPPEIYDTMALTPSSPKISPDSPRLGMIRTLTGGISGGSNGQKSSRKSTQNPSSGKLEGFIPSSSQKSSDNLANIGVNGDYENGMNTLQEKRLSYVGDVDMPGRMNIIPENEEIEIPYGYDEFEDGDDEETQYSTDNQDNEYEYSTDDQDDEYGDEDIPAEIDLSDIPY